MSEVVPHNAADLAAFTVALGGITWSTERKSICIRDARGYSIFNPHTFVLEDGGMKQTDAEHLAFKKIAYPMGPLNPGKKHAWYTLQRAAR